MKPASALAEVPDEKCSQPLCQEVRVSLTWAASPQSISLSPSHAAEGTHRRTESRKQRMHIKDAWFFPLEGARTRAHGSGSLRASIPCSQPEQCTHRRQRKCGEAPSSGGLTPPTCAHRPRQQRPRPVFSRPPLLSRQPAPEIPHTQAFPFPTHQPRLLGIPAAGLGGLDHSGHPPICTPLASFCGRHPTPA